MTNLLNNFKILCLSFIDFNGRTTPKNYWIYIGSSFAFLFICGLALGFMNVNIDTLGWSLIFALAGFILYPAVIIRRLKDAGYKGWWMLTLFIPIPILPYIVLIIIGCLKTVPVTLDDVDVVEAEIVE